MTTITPLRLYAITLIALLLHSATPASAQDFEFGKLRVGYVNVKTIAERSVAIQKRIKLAEDKLRLQQEELDIRIREFRGEAEALTARRSVLSAEEIAKKEKEIEVMRDAVDMAQLDINRQIRKAESEVMEPAVNDILAMVKKVAERDKFDLVLTSDVVVYGRETLDISPLIIKELDSAVRTDQEK